MRVLTALLALACTAALADQTPSPASAAVYTIQPAAGDLPPGKHTLQLLFADFTHTPFVPNVASKKITITVTK